MDQEFATNEQTVLPQWSALMESTARAIGLPFHPVLVRGWLEGHEFLACVKKLGGELVTVPAFDGWVLATDDDHCTEGLKAIMPEYSAGSVSVGDFHGLLELRLDGKRFLALRTEERLLNYSVRPALVLGGPSLEATLALADRIKVVHAELFRTLEHVRVYGSRLAVPEKQPIAETDLVLPSAFKKELLGKLPYRVDS